MKNILPVLILSIGSTAFAGAPSKQSGQSGWTSATHGGFAVVDTSSTGFERVSGSVLFLDLARRFGGTFSAGIRTMAQGGSDDGHEFYRLGAGPMISWTFYRNWSLDLAVTRFSESGLTEDGDQTYASSGQALMAGWERNVAVTRRVRLAWGGFIATHRGDLRLTSHEAAQTRYANAGMNQGLTHGVEVALKIDL